MRSIRRRLSESGAQVSIGLLLAYINAFFFVQIAVVLGIILLKRNGAGAAVPNPPRLDAPPVAVGTWTGLREFRVIRREFADRARTQCSFYLQPADGGTLPAYKPGQFLTFALKVPGGDGDENLGEATIRRCYSLSDRPGSGSYRITIKRALAPLDRPELAPGVSSGHFHDRINVGDVLSVAAPAGKFLLETDDDVPAVLVAGGVGITPLMSMLRWSLEEHPGRTVHLYYGVRSGEEQAFKTELAAIAAGHSCFHLNVVYSKPGPADRQGSDFQFTGHVDLEMLRRTLPHGRHQFYICGPAPMMESLVPALVRWGVPQKDVHFEAFGPATVRLDSAPATDAAGLSGLPFDIRFRRSGRTLAWNGEDANLLDFAERHGVVVSSGCRSGSCGSCETGFADGAVHYEHTPDYEVRPGHCLLCVGKPESALVLQA